MRKKQNKRRTAEANSDWKKSVCERQRQAARNDVSDEEEDRHGPSCFDWRDLECGKQILQDSLLFLTLNTAPERI